MEPLAYANRALKRTECRPVRIKFQRERFVKTHGNWLEPFKSSLYSLYFIYFTSQTYSQPHSISSKMDVGWFCKPCRCFNDVLTTQPWQHKWATYTFVDKQMAMRKINDAWTTAVSWRFGVEWGENSHQRGNGDDCVCGTGRSVTVQSALPITFRSRSIWSSVAGPIIRWNTEHAATPFTRSYMARYISRAA